MKLLKGNDLKAVIARSQLTPLAGSDASDTEVYATVFSVLPRRTEVLWLRGESTSVWLGTEKGERKVGCTFGCDCYSLSLHTFF